MNYQPQLTIVGYGTIGKVYSQVLDSLQIKHSVCDPASAEFKGKIYKSHTDANIDSEIIIIATPPSSHYELAKYFLKKNKKVVIEKPAVIHNHQLQELLTYLKTGQLYFSYHTSFNPVFRQARRFLLNKKIKSIQVTYQEDVHFYHGANSWVFDKNISGGGCLIDSGINIFSVLHQFVGYINFEEVKSQSRNVPVEDFVSIEGKSIDGTKLKISIDWMNSNECRKYVFDLVDGSRLEFDLASGNIILNGKIVNSSDSEKVDHEAEYTLLVEDMLNYFSENSSSTARFTKPLESIFALYKYITSNQKNN